MYRADEPDEKPAKGRLLKWMAIAGLYAISLTLATGVLLWNALFAQMPELPEKDALWAMNREPAIEFIDATGKTVAVRGPRYGARIQPADLPPHVLQAILAVEDARFYSHEGVDRIAILRAAWANWRAGETVQGGSTLTQQLVKNLFLTPEKTLRRKAQEARLAFDLEERLSKEEILELYINRIFLGARSYGLDAAAHRYFGKRPEDLSIAEAALIAGLAQAPSRFSPIVDMDAAIQRRNIVIDRMIASRYLTPGAGERAKTEPVDLVSEDYPAHFGYALDYATEQASNLASREAPDMVIVLTIDPALQTAAHEHLNAGLDRDGEAKRVSQGAAVLIDKTGAIRAMAGGRNYLESQFNRAVQAKRQPGSAFKSFVYAAAVQNGLHPYTVRYDEPIVIDNWKPKNYGGGHRGAVTLSEAFAESLNTVAAELGQEIGLEKIIETARRFGVRSPLQAYPSLALGSEGTDLLELTQAYGVFATGGQRMDAHIVSEIRTSRGEVLYRHQSFDPVQVYPAQFNRKMVGMMSRVVNRGTGAKARLPIATEEPVENVSISSVPRAVAYRDAAGKTGTSQDWRDAVFVGFTADFVAGVWVGNDDETPMRRITGGDLPAEIWRDVMFDAHAELPVSELRGAEDANALTSETERKLAFYRSVADAFASLEARRVSSQ